MELKNAKKTWLIAGATIAALIGAVLLASRRPPPAIEALDTNMDRLTSAVRQFQAANETSTPTINPAQAVTDICFIARQIDTDLYKIAVQLKRLGPDYRGEWKSMLESHFESHASDLRTEVGRVSVAMKVSGLSETQFRGAKFNNKAELCFSTATSSGGLQVFNIEKFSNTDINALLKNIE